ncbi:T-complex protein 11, putative isoform 2 [Hibiscus syriacus]|uniref:T-complex protein 11, putative isoform 2 n=1 Tax=Hibiscus syriacus TaxID=106335 RepID=A0A6A3AS41_HIBSY|nr:T-complex protein 11, putative isoform 2 [Hibiscus syriacus]
MSKLLAKHMRKGRGKRLLKEVEKEVKDAQLVEEDLVRAACQLEISMIQKCKMTPEGVNTALTHDMKAIKRKDSLFVSFLVVEDQKLLREKVQHLSGDAGIERMELALSETPTKLFQAKESGNPMESPLTSFISPNTHGSPRSSTAQKDDRSGLLTQTPDRVVRSLFKENGTSPSKNYVSPASSSNSHSDAQLGSSVEKPIVTENELIVNEFLHGQCGFVDTSSAIIEDKNSIKAKAREMMEKALWDRIMESMQQDEPDFDLVIELVREVRDEICELAPRSWREEITDAIDLEILSQPMMEIEAANQSLLKELAEICEARGNSDNSPALAMVKGLRFVLEQIQVMSSKNARERVDVLVRLGLLKLVSKVSGLTPDALLESFTLNFSRLRDVQAEIQKIIVISTRQILSSEQVISSSADMERIASNCAERLFKFLDSVEEAGIEGIVETSSGISRDDDDKVTDDKILQTRKAIPWRGC